jgi:hypothetical protein
MSEAISPVLELSTLPQRHPNVGDALLNRCGAACVLRLGIDPVQQPAGTLKREVTIDRASPATKGRQIQEVRTIGWSELPHLSEDFCLRWSLAFNRNDITEDAAIGVMALLIHALEGMTLEKVSQIGSGCDYYLRVGPRTKLLPLEVSGICEETSAGQRQSRLKEKCNQVLTHNRAGFVSVTTFRCAADDLVHSYLHLVEKRKSKRKKGRSNKAKRRKRS